MRRQLGGVVTFAKEFVCSRSECLPLENDIKEGCQQQDGGGRSQPAYRHDRVYPAQTRHLVVQHDYIGLDGTAAQGREEFHRGTELRSAIEVAFRLQQLNQQISDFIIIIRKPDVNRA
jgi:hypothetical protein